MALSTFTGPLLSRVFNRGLPIHRPRFNRNLQVFSYLHRGQQFRSGKSGTSPLALLRKKTGYSLSSCKKVLAECDQDVNRAEEMLEEQAQQQGWNKASKLDGRNTTQGLVGVAQAAGAVAMVELNSETDFVARNKQFHVLLNSILEVCLSQASVISDRGQDRVSIKHLEKSELAVIPTKEGKTLADLVALSIGQIGENLILRRAVLYLANRPDVSLSFLTHPSASFLSTGVAYGRFGAVLSYVKERNGGIVPEGQTTESLARQLCQHVIGMNPQSLGDINQETRKGKETVNRKLEEIKGEGEQEDEDWSHLEDELSTNSSTELLNQVFLTNPDITVKELLLESGLRVTDFSRFEVGETL